MSMYRCQICQKEFWPKDLKRPAKTCSKECKNILAKTITIKQFSDPAAREIQRQKSLEKKQDPLYRARHAEAISKRTQRWKEQGHPRTGMLHCDKTKQAIGDANRSRYKGKTWDEIYGKDVADRRRLENSLSMSKKNEVLLKEKRSSLEESLVPYLPAYENNIQIGRYNVDFINKTTKHIIEVYGDYWHCNPNKYPDDYYHPYFKITAAERRKMDEQRVEYLTELGYSVTIVWEEDLTEFIKSI